MRKLTLTLALLVGAISFSIAQSGASNGKSTKEVKTNKAVVLTEKKPSVEVRSVKAKKLEMAPVKSEEAIIEEKKTNQK